MSDPLRVLLADDQILTRSGIRALLELADEVSMVGEASDADEVLRLLEGRDVDVVVLDLAMAGRGGVGTLAAMAERGLDLPVLVLTTFDDDAQLLAALRAGAKGYLLKDVTLEQLVSGIRCLAAGGTVLQSALMERLLRVMGAD